jgi:hypothetical protein
MVCIVCIKFEELKDRKDATDPEALWFTQLWA